MEYAALSCLGDALDATRELLFPVDRGLWLRLAVVVFFLSGGSGVGSLPNLSWQFPAGNVEGRRQIPCRSMLCRWHWSTSISRSSSASR